MVEWSNKILTKYKLADYGVMFLCCMTIHKAFSVKSFFLNLTLVIWVVRCTFFSLKQRKVTIVRTEICWLLLYWSNCLFSSQLRLFYRPMMSFSLLPLHAWKSNLPPPPFSHNTSLNSMFNKWNNKIWQVLLSPFSMIPSLPHSLFPCQGLWGECLALCTQKKCPTTWWSLSA